jgi:cytochrome c
MFNHSVLWLAGVSVLVASSAPQSPEALRIGRPATESEVRARDIDVLPDGTGLPSGEGDAVIGKGVFLAKCARCHGPGGEGSASYPRLAGGLGTLGTSAPVLTVGSYWPYSTTLWDYIHRAMPYPQPGSLTPRETYAVTAYILYLNEVIGEKDVMNAQTLPKVRMRNRAGFIMGSEDLDSTR